MVIIQVRGFDQVQLSVHLHLVTVLYYVDMFLVNNKSYDD